jgi:hypothetical protein
MSWSTATLRATPRGRVRELCDRTPASAATASWRYRPKRGSGRCGSPESDGSEAEKKQSGVRIFARFLWDLRYVAPRALNRDAGRAVGRGWR